jgi:hypothetical protein
MNAECRMQNAEWKPRKRRALRRVVTVLFSSFIILHSAFPASAAPTQEEVFKSIKQNVGHQSEGSGKGMAILAGGAGALILVMLLGSRVKRRQTSPQPLHHSGRLLREVMKTVPLKKKELKQLKLLAEASRDEEGEGVQSPLTLLLCPSVLSRTLKNHPVKIDRAVMSNVVRKMGVGKVSQR